MNIKWLSALLALASLTGCNMFNGGITRYFHDKPEETYTVPKKKTDFTKFVQYEILPLVDYESATAWDASALREAMSPEQRKSIVKVDEEKGIADGFDTLRIEIQLKDAVAFGYPIKSLYWIIGAEFSVSKVKFTDYYSLSQVSQKFANSDFKSHDGAQLCMTIDDYDNQGNVVYALKHTLYDKNGRRLPRLSENTGCSIIGIINFDLNELTISSQSGV
ncbi:hypothetical protein [uncultured Actinobacillus sp.]|uniref:hypothetical protein n=1 Tax=uncultured Actinobacillus sp. TaxID=417616 RepID=UPI0025F352B7|nr:hypothetical protein [uncultured Actinobacillus sp.]